MSSQVSGRRLRPDVIVGLGNEIARDDGVGAKELERSGGRSSPRPTASPAASC